MQAVIALCYFCENHGPRVVMVCQPMRSRYNEKKDDYLPNDNNMDTDDETLRFYGDIGSHEDVVDKQERCAACSSFGNGLGILSNDHEAATSYVSTQAAIHERVNNIVKAACMRSLLVEVSTPLCAGPDTSSCSNGPSGSAQLNPIHKPSDTDEATDGVVLFGNDTEGYVLSQTFRLKDAKARGFKRRYSLIVITRDKMMLLSNYEFFLGGLSAMIAKLKAVAEKQCAIEQQFDMDVRIAVAAQSNRGSFMPQRFYPRKVELDTSRSLTEITNNKDIFILLHRQMLYLLRMQSMLDQDVVLEGVPTQDMLVLMEMKQSNMEESDLLMLSVQQSFVHFYNLRNIVDKLCAIDPKVLTNLIWHVVVGGQVVVRSDSRSLRQSFLLALINLVPLGCARLLSNSTVYQHSYKYNLLGCPLAVQIPDDVKDEVFEIEIHAGYSISRCSSSQQQQRYDCVGSSSACSSSSLVTDNSGGDVSVDSTNTCTAKTRDRQSAQEKDSNDGIPILDTEDLSLSDFHIKNVPLRNGAKPMIVKRYLDLLLHPLLNVSALESSIRSTRYDWLNRAKLIFQLRHQKEGIDISKIIKIIKCGTESGLSRRYKQVVLNTINSQSSSQSSATAAMSAHTTPRPMCSPTSNAARSVPNTQRHKLTARMNSSAGEHRSSRLRAPPSSASLLVATPPLPTVDMNLRRNHSEEVEMDTSSR